MMKRIIILLLCLVLLSGMSVSASEGREGKGRGSQEQTDAPDEEEIAAMAAAYEEGNPGVKAIAVNIKDIANKFGTDPDYEKLFQEQLDTAEGGDRKAPRYVGLFYELGLGVEADTEEAVRYYETGVERGDLTSSYYLGLMYETGADPDYAKAAGLFASVEGSDNKSATGVVEAGYELAVLYEQGLGVERDLGKAKELYQEAAGYGCEEAAAALERLKEK